MLKSRGAAREKSPKEVIAIIPARYESTRLPGKLMLPISGKPLILHTLDRAKAASTIDRVVVATDDERIRDAVSEAGDEAVVTSSAHRSGSDRIAEVARALPEGTTIVNVQGDEPLISSQTIDRVARALLHDESADMSTACEPIDELSELLNFNNVKVSVGENGHALYFSRSPFPFPRDASLRHGGDPNRALTEEPEMMSIFRKHVGIYAYRREYLFRFAQLPPTRLEKLEQLEQLRALEQGAKIKVVDAVGRSIGVDTQEDFDRVRDLIEIGVDFRPARRSDLPRIAAVHVESWQKSFADIAPKDFLKSMSVEKRLEAYSQRRCNGPYTMMVAEHPTQGIVGFADFGKPKLNVDFDAQIYSFYFLPEFQRKGFGERLFRQCVSRLTRDGMSSLCLDALEVSPYRRFYDKMGGRVVGHDGHKLGDVDFETVIYGWDDLSKL